MSKKGSKSRGRVNNSNATRSIWSDQSGRVPRENFKLPTLPDWFYEPRAFQQRARLRRLATQRRRLVRYAAAYTILQGAEDRREWHPSGPLHRPAFLTSGVQHAPLSIGKRKRGAVIKARRSRVAEVSRPYHTVAFAAPRSVAICVRRQTRRQVMHAIGKAGKVGQRRPRRNQHSGVSCGSI